MAVLAFACVLAAFPLGVPSMDYVPLSALNDREEIAALAKLEIRAKYLKGQQEHQTDLPTGGLSWFAAAAREEAIDQIAYTHHIGQKCLQLRQLHGRMCEGLMTLAQAAEEMGVIISCNPPESLPQA